MLSRTSTASSSSSFKQRMMREDNKRPSRRCHSLQELANPLPFAQKCKEVWKNSGVHFEHHYKQDVCNISAYLVYPEVLFDEDRKRFTYWEQKFLKTNFNPSDTTGMSLLQYFRRIGPLETKYVLKSQRFLQSMELEDDLKRQKIQSLFKQQEDQDCKHAVRPLKYKNGWSTWLKEYIKKENEMNLNIGLSNEHFWKNQKRKQKIM